MLLEYAVYRGDNYIITVTGDGETNYGFDNEPYFKIFKKNQCYDGAPCVRISLKDGHIIKHNSGNDKNLLKLSSKEAKNIKKILKEKAPNTNKDKFKNCKTVWDGIITAAEDEAKGNNFDKNKYKEEPERIYWEE